MSRKPLTGFPRGPGIYYVCPTWKECRAGNWMWQAISEKIFGLVGRDNWECTCGCPMNIEITWDQARRELRAE